MVVHAKTYIISIENRLTTRWKMNRAGLPFVGYCESLFHNKMDMTSAEILEALPQLQDVFQLYDNDISGANKIQIATCASTEMLECHFPNQPTPLQQVAKDIAQRANQGLHEIHPGNLFNTICLFLLQVILPLCMAAVCLW